MKKLIALAVASVVATSANAITTGLQSDTNGELILTVINVDDNNAFVQGLGFNTVDIFTDLSAKKLDGMTFTVDQSALNQIGGVGANLVFNVTGLNYDTNTTAYPREENPNYRSTRGVVLTGAKDAKSRGHAALDKGTYANAFGNLSSLIGGDTIEENVVVSMNGMQGIGGPNWGVENYQMASVISGYSTERTSFSFDQVADFWAVQYFDDKSTGEFFGEDQYKGYKLGSWAMVDGGQLVFEAEQVNEIPVPAAAWLFGSAIAGLAAARRRK